MRWWCFSLDLGKERRGERGRVLTGAPCRGEAGVEVVVVVDDVLPRRLLVREGSTGGDAPVQPFSMFCRRKKLAMLLGAAPGHEEV